MVILAIDPGTTESAAVLWDGKTILDHQILDNGAMEQYLTQERFDICAVEYMRSYGMSVGVEVFQTCYWIGEFRHICKASFRRFYPVFRGDVKLHLCQSPRAKDGNVRQALLDRVGPVGTKAQPGACYGVHTHEWSSLAIAVYAFDFFIKGIK